MFTQCAHTHLAVTVTDLRVVVVTPLPRHGVRRRLRADAATARQQRRALLEVLVDAEDAVRGQLGHQLTAQ